MESIRLDRSDQVTDPDYLKLLTDAGAQVLHARRTEWFSKRRPDEKRLLEKIETLVVNRPLTTFSVRDAIVCIDADITPDDDWRQQFASLLKELMPWKKGPFRLFETLLDAEWRSDLKWNRIASHAAFSGKVVGDIGSHNGYFMFAAAPLSPRLIIGIEPVFRPVAQFKLVQGLASVPSLFTEPIGIADIDVVYPNFFDTLLCMGILYHQTDPVGCLRKMHAALRPGGEVIVECQGIAGDDSNVLVPAGKYCGASGIWWLPTPLALQHWILRAGFRDVELFHSAPLGVDEQRATSWAPIKSLSDFLDPLDSAKTVEGYPAPWRHIVRARR